MLEWIILGWCCLGVSVILVIAGIVVWAISHRRNMQWEEPQMAKPAADGENAPDDTTQKRDRRRLQRRGNFFNKPRRRHMVAPFYKFLAFFFFGAACLFLPVYLSEADWDGVQWIRSVLLSFHNAMRLFVLDGDFQGFQKVISENLNFEWLKQIYTIYAAAVFVAAPVLTAKFVLSFFRNIGAVISYLACRPKRLVYMSELNERSLALAENILRQDRKKTRVIFCDVFEKNEEEEFELITTARRLGAICFRRDVTQIPLRRLRSAKRTFYLIGENEDENLEQALFLLRYCRSDDLYNTENTRIYMFSVNPVSGLLLETMDQGNAAAYLGNEECDSRGEAKAYPVNQARSLAWRTVMEKKIFSEFMIEKNGKGEEEKVVSVLIVGGGGYGMELAKVILWCGQLPGYRVKVHVVDCKENARSLLESQAPELLARSECNKEGYPRYELKIHEGIDVNSVEFDHLIKKKGPFTRVFVTLGDDDKNVATAMKINREVLREKIDGEFPEIYNLRGLCTDQNKRMPLINAVVYSSLKLAPLRNSGERLRCVGKYDYDIDFFGDVKSCYSPEVIEPEALDGRAEEVHEAWGKETNEKKWKDDVAACGGDEEKAKQRGEERFKQYKYEYYRESSRATAQYEDMLKELGIDMKKEISEKYEHLRWYVYMSASGFRLGETTDFVAKTHSAMIDYETKKAREDSQKETEEK